jgi:ubiquinone biosynthesis protein UbiJ
MYTVLINDIRKGNQRFIGGEGTQLRGNIGDSLAVLNQSIIGKKEDQDMRKQIKILRDEKKHLEAKVAQMIEEMDVIKHMSKNDGYALTITIFIGSKHFF